MKVYFVLWKYGFYPPEFPKKPSAGLENAMWEIAKQITGKYPVTIYSLGSKSRDEKIAGINFRVYKAPSIFSSNWIRPDVYFYSIMRKIKGEIKNEKEKAILQAVSCIEPALFANEKIALVQALQVELQKYLPFPKAKKKIYMRHFNKFRYAVGASLYLTTVFLQNFNFPKGNAETIYNGVDIKVFNEKAKNRQLINKRYNADENKPLLCFASRIKENKGLHVLLEAVEGMDLTLIAAAPIEEKTPYYREMLKKMNNMRNVKFIGTATRGEIASLMASSDAFICPSIYAEPLGMVNLEAMACGTPVIAFKKGGVGEIIKDGYNGLLCEEANAESLRDAINLLVEDSGMRKKLGKNAALFTNDFSWEKIGKQYIELYEKLIQ